MSNHYTLTYLRKWKSGNGKGQHDFVAADDDDARKIARGFILVGEVILFTPILVCVDDTTQSNLLPYYSHDDEMNHYERRSGQETPYSTVTGQPRYHPEGRSIGKLDRRTDPEERRVNYARLVKAGTRFYRHNEAMAEVNQRKATKERRKV